MIIEEGPLIFLASRMNVTITLIFLAKTPFLHNSLSLSLSAQLVKPIFLPKKEANDSNRRGDSPDNNLPSYLSSSLAFHSH
ncbi:hypothetical protein NC652_000589 [Populus alba x Populus x berolinensis]|nr:hypothetical protein NC652_000589 [Populus alba x Populus x berolinensis]